MSLNKPHKRFYRIAASAAAAWVCVLWMLASCSAPETPTPPVPPRETATPSASPGPAFTPTFTPSPTPLPSPTPSDFLVAILNRRLSRAEIADAIRREGTVVVGGFNYAARDAMVQQFQAYVKREFGVDVTLNYVSEPNSSTFLEQLDAARRANQPAPYDVIAVEPEIFEQVQQRGESEAMTTSDFVAAPRIDPVLRREPYAIAFQSAATVAPIFHGDAIGAWFHDWQDLADRRLNRRITLPKSDTPEAGAFLIGVAGSLGKDYRNPQQMSEAIDFVCTRIVPNALETTNDFSEMQQLLREDRIDAAVTWNLLARLEGLSGADGTQDMTFRPMASGQPALNGYAWIPKGAPHPVLAQMFIGWRLNEAGQFPSEAWGISNAAWGEYHEGLLGSAYEQSIPEWVRANYFQFYPTLEQVETLYKPVDWAYYREHQGEWMGKYGKCL